MPAAAGGGAFARAPPGRAWTPRADERRRPGHVWATRRFALVAVLVYQLTLLHRHERGLPLDTLRVGLKPYLLAA